LRETRDLPSPADNAILPRILIRVEDYDDRGLIHA
jgi:hypothetical protein